MVYGLISQLDNENTMIFFRGKKIQEENIADSYHLGELARHLKRGDAVYTMSVNRFNNITRLLSFGRFCMVNGVDLHFMAQPYLDIAKGKHWRDSVIWQMERAKAIEYACKNALAQGFKMSNEQWNFLFQCIEEMNLEVLAHTFNPDGILKRGN